MRFHSAMATLEPQKYVIAGTVGTENFLLVSGRLVMVQFENVKKIGPAQGSNSHASTAQTSGLLFKPLLKSVFSLKPPAKS